MNQSHLFPSTTTVSDSLVECLGLHFASDDERRAHFTALLREKLRDPHFRAIEGFPIGSDEDILALSDPPYYTACPNPFIADFIRAYGRPYDPAEPYHREPFAADVSEGKNDPIYNAHSYHTKVPHKAIMRYILHYTKPGDMVLDGFCGTGMTGVAAQMCGSPDAEFKAKIEQEWIDAGRDAPEWGARRAILGDLSPAATFIAYNYNTPVDVVAFEREAKRILAEVEAECGWMYETTHTDGRKGRINFVLWSDVFVCPNCASEVIFWDVAVDTVAKSIHKTFLCPICDVNLTKRKMERAWVTKIDSAINTAIQQPKQVPVLINYMVDQQRFKKKPDNFDLDLINKSEDVFMSYWFPSNRMPEGDEARRNDDIGITHVHHFYDSRSLYLLAVLRSHILSKEDRVNREVMLVHSAVNPYASKMRRYRPDNKGGGPLSGTLYISSLITPPNVILSMQRNQEAIKEAASKMKWSSGSSVVATQSATNTTYIPDNSVDYIFTDPPFGSNLWYSELNFLWEAWLKVFTNNAFEAVESKKQQKTLSDYQRIMELCYCEYFRVLKPGYWMTVVFSNTRAAVWNAIQIALEQAGFVVANVAALDKQQRSFKAVTTPTAVKQDLVISCYKPSSGLTQRFKQANGSEIGAWDFIRSHLSYLPVFLEREGVAQEVVERTPRILYDRLVAYFVQHGYPVPLSASEFQAGLEQRFSVREGMYFLPEQVEEYERKRMTVREVQQLSIFVSDEASAIQWVRQQLTNKPQTTSDLTPAFMKELTAWMKHEKQPELRDLLAENFLAYDGDGAIPAQIVGWLRKSAELRDVIKADIESGAASEDNGALVTPNARLLAAARDRWYVPDPNRAIDLEKVRLRGLLREFNSYIEGRGRLKVFRTEAVKAGFKDAWNRKDYALIVRVAERLPDSVVEEDADLLMYVDNARLRVG